MFHDVISRQLLSLLYRFFMLKVLYMASVWQMYTAWVRENEPAVTGIERIIRGLALTFANVESLLSMESMWTLSKVHSLTNQWILSTKNRPVRWSDIATWLLALLQEVGSLGEIFMRHKVSHKAGWLFVVLLLTVKTIVRSLLRRESWAKAVTTLRDFAAARAERKTDSISRRPAPLTALVVPRVVGASSVAQRTATWSDLTALVVDTYLLFRSVSCAFLAYFAFPKGRLDTRASYSFNQPTQTSVQSLKVSLSPKWSVWRKIVIADLIALLLSHVVQRNRVPTVLATESPTEETVEVDGNVTPAVDANEDDLRIANIRYLLTLSAFQDPFFSIVMKPVISKYFVHGCLNRIPLLGGFAAAQTNYVLSLQQHSLLYNLH